MYTDIDMSGGGTSHSITNAATIGAQTLTASNSITDSGTLSVTGTATFGSTVSAAGIVSAQDFVINALSGTKASQGVYQVTIASNGSTVSKPSCPAGLSPQIFVVPATMSDNGTGAAMSSFENWATDNGASWPVNMRLLTENGWIIPTAAYGQAVAIPKCG